MASKFDLPYMYWKAPSPTPGEIAIISWDAPTDGFTPSFVNALRDAGFNLCLAGAIVSMSTLDNTLATIAAANLKYFVRYGASNPVLDVNRYVVRTPTEVEEKIKPDQIEAILPSSNDIWGESYGYWTTLANHLTSPINSQVNGEIVDLRNYIAGFMIAEEPRVTSFWGVSSYAHLLFDKLFNKLPTGQFPGFYINFLPNLIADTTNNGTQPVYSDANLKRYAGGMNELASMIGGYTPITSYDDYLTLAERLMNLSFVSFDSYPFYIYEGIQNYEEACGNQMIQFFSSLICFQQRKKRTGMDFWSVIFCVKRRRVVVKVGDEISKDVNSGTPTIGQIRFSVYTSLLYGANGIAYWTTVANSTPNLKFVEIEGENNTETTYEYNSEAPFTPGGATTSIYTSVKSVNMAVKTVQDIFLNTKIAMTAVTTAPPHVSGLTKIPGIPSTKTNFGLFEKIEAAGKGVVMAHLYNWDYNYLAVVNMDYANSQSVTFTLRTGATRVFRGGENAGFAGKIPAGARTEVLAPGDMRIFRYAR